MFLAKVCNLGQFFLGPDTTTWVMWATENIKFNIIIDDIAFQLFEINLEMSIDLNKAILNQLRLFNRTERANGGYTGVLIRTASPSLVKA